MRRTSGWLGVGVGDLVGDWGGDAWLARLAGLAGWLAAWLARLGWLAWLAGWLPGWPG